MSLVIASGQHNAPFVGGRNVPPTLTTTYESGGVALNDISRGHLHQIWWSTVENGRDIKLAATNVAPTTVLSVGAGGVTEMSFTFDHQMRPVIAYVTGTTVRLSWFDPTLNRNDVRVFTGIRNPRLTLEDKRSTAVADTRIIFAYLKDDALCYRVHTDRFSTEYQLKSGVGNDQLVRIGMATNNRLRFELGYRAEGTLWGTGSFMRFIFSEKRRDYVRPFLPADSFRQLYYTDGERPMFVVDRQHWPLEVPRPPTNVTLSNPALDQVNISVQAARDALAANQVEIDEKEQEIADFTAPGSPLREAEAAIVGLETTLEAAIIARNTYESSLGEEGRNAWDAAINERYSGDGAWAQHRRNHITATLANAWNLPPDVVNSWRANSNSKTIYKNWSVPFTAKRNEFRTEFRANQYIVQANGAFRANTTWENRNTVLADIQQLYNTIHVVCRTHYATNHRIHGDITYYTWAVHDGCIGSDGYMSRKIHSTLLNPVRTSGWAGRFYYYNQSIYNSFGRSRFDAQSWRLQDGIQLLRLMTFRTDLYEFEQLLRDIITTFGGDPAQIAALDQAVTDARDALNTANAGVATLRGELERLEAELNGLMRIKEQLALDLSRAESEVGGIAGMRRVSYALVYVDKFGRVSQTSDPTGTMLWAEQYPTQVTIDLGDFIDEIRVANGWPNAIEGKIRLFRSNETAAGRGAFQFAQEFDVTPTIQWTDDVRPAELTYVSFSDNWFAPKDELRGLVHAPGDFLMAFSDTEVFASEALVPYAWSYSWGFQERIMGLVPIHGGVLVVTDRNPWLMVGTDPQSLVKVAIEAEFDVSCISPRSIVDMGSYAVYASGHGLVAVQGAQATLLTKDRFNERSWAQFNPKTFRGFRSANRYVAPYDEITDGVASERGVCVVYDFDTHQVFTLEGFHIIDAAYNPWDENTYVITGPVNNRHLALFDLDGDAGLQSIVRQERMTGRWRSKQYMFSDRTSISSVRVEATGYPVKLKFTHDHGSFDVEIKNDRMVKLPAVKSLRWDITLESKHEVSLINFANSAGKII